MSRNLSSTLPLQDVKNRDNSRYFSAHPTDGFGGRFVGRSRDNLAEAYLMLIQLVRSRIITSPTRRSAENLVVMLEEELAQRIEPEKSDKTA